MIPVEKIAGGTIGNLVYYVAIVGLLLVIAIDAVNCSKNK